MCKIVKNASLKLIEQRSKLEFVEFLDQCEAEIIDNVNIAEEYLSDTEYQRMLRDIKNMDQIYREVLYFYYIEGKSVKQIASTLDRPISTVKSQLQRGKKYLQEKWGPIYDSKTI